MKQILQSQFPDKCVQIYKLDNGYSVSFTTTGKGFSKEIFDWYQERKIKKPLIDTFLFAAKLLAIGIFSCWLLYHFEVAEIFIVYAATFSAAVVFVISYFRYSQFSKSYRNSVLLDQDIECKINLQFDLSNQSVRLEPDILFASRYRDFVYLPDFVDAKYFRPDERIEGVIHFPIDDESRFVISTKERPSPDKSKASLSVLEYRSGTSLSIRHMKIVMGYGAADTERTKIISLALNYVTNTTRTDIGMEDSATETRSDYNPMD